MGAPRVRIQHTGFMTSPLSKLGLGSAQFGLDQSVGVRGRSPQADARDILDIAARSQLAVFDVAGHSAMAETALGEVMPRPNPFRVSISTVRADRGPDFVEQEARAALRRMGVEQADAILVPAASELFGPQAPASLLDQRLLIDGTLAALTGYGIEVHLRSIFLNGLLFLPPDRAPNHLKAAASRISRARRLIAEGKSDPLQAALGFALSRPEAATVLVGVSSPAELSAVIAAASRPPPDLDWDEMALDDPVALDPRAWAAA